MGKAESEGSVKEGQDCPEEAYWSQADECCYAKEAVGDDESKVGGEEEGVAEPAALNSLGGGISESRELPSTADVRTIPTLTAC